MIILQLLFWFVELTLVLGIFSYCLYITGLFLSRFFEVPYVPTGRETIEKVFSYIHPTKDMKILELGCGNGRVLCSAVKRYGAHGKGVDMNPAFIFFARIRARLMGISKNVEFISGNAWETDWSSTDVIYLFMIPAFLNAPRFLQKIGDEARSGTYIVSHWFEIEHIRSKEVHKIHSGQHVTYVYRI